ncbi:MAG: TolC family protein [Flavisolibacter sp.]
MNRFLTFILIALFSSPAWAQTYTLDQAINKALENNVNVRQSKLLVDVAAVNLSQARGNLLPSLNAELNHGVNQGRSIDPFTNSYVNQSVSYAGYGASTGVVLFNGLSLQNTLRQQQRNYEAGKLEWQQEKDNLVLNVVLAYLSVLSSRDQLASAREQARLSEQQLERLKIMDSKGAVSPSQVTDMQGQLMNDRLNIENLRSQMEVNKLTLAQMMNVRYSKDMQVEDLAPEPFSDAGADAEGVYSRALEHIPAVKAANLRADAAAFGVKSARGQTLPSLVLGANVQTNYSSVAQNATGKIPYNEQLQNNLFSTVNLGLRVPLFNGRQAKNRVKLAEIEVNNAELQEESVKLQLKQQVEQASLNATNAMERYRLLQEQVKAFGQSFTAAEARFNAGVGTTIDYLTAKTNLDRAQLNLINAQYEYILRKKILDYYNGQ